KLINDPPYYLTDQINIPEGKPVNVCVCVCADLMQILSHVVEEVRDSVGRDINGADLLYGLLNAPWLQSLLKVYECLQQYLTSSTTPHLSYASGLSLEILSDLRALPYPSNEARELYTLLTEPHLQALLSAHDVVGLKDYEPILPPLPADLPEDEEAMRIVCLVKNKQPLKSRVGRGIRSHWDTLRKLTRHRLIPAQKAQSGGLFTNKHETPQKVINSSAEVPSSSKPVQLKTPSYTKHADSCKICHRCNSFWDRSFSCSAPCVCSSVVTAFFICLLLSSGPLLFSFGDDFIDDMGVVDVRDMRNPILPVHPHYTLSPWTHTNIPCYYLTPCCYPSNTPSLTPKMTCYAHTAPPSPRHCHRVMKPTGNPPAELLKQESLAELCSTFQQVANHIEHRSHNVQLLGQRMAAATERMSESVQENAQALAMLAQVVDKLQGLVAASSAASGPWTSEEAFEGPMENGSGYNTEECTQSGSAYPCASAHLRELVNTSGAASSPHTVETSPEPAIRKTMSPQARNEELCAGASCSGQLQDLGATIRRDETTGEIYVARVIHGGLADRSGLLHAGDRLVEVNGHPVFGLEPEQIIQILANSHGTVMFKVVPITDRPVNNQTMLYVRALVDYSPQQDPAIPCADAGMGFRRGDLLEIVDQTDALWWQAKKLPCSSACAGLIPSSSLLRRKQREFWWSQPYQPHTCIKTCEYSSHVSLFVCSPGDMKCTLKVYGLVCGLCSAFVVVFTVVLGMSTVDEEDDILAIDVTFIEADEEAFESEESEFSTNIEGIYLAGFRRSMRLCRRRRVHGGGSGLSCSLRCASSCYSALANPYEEVVRYQRHPEDTHRLIVLLGPSGVGVNELRRRLIEINPKTYQGATPHTTRPLRSHEEPGREYHFISKDQFENMVYNQCFIEYGEYRGHFYGTSVEAVKDVLTAGRICVIDIEPYAIESVRTHELRGYIIYIKPPPLDQMKRTRMNSQLITSYYTTRPFKDEDYQEIEEGGRRMEQHYSQFFDHVIVNDGLQASCVQLLTAVRRAQDEPQWVPTSWIRPTIQF
ncbi:hypothetical protein NFI96_030706, partial [Prochilodus magdalenae]